MNEKVAHAKEQSGAVKSGYSTGEVLPNTHPFANRTAAGICHFRILETTDLHAHLCAYDYYHDQPSHTVGLARTATLIRKARAEVDNALLLDNGDLLQGSPIGDVHAASPNAATHPMIAAMNALGYDAATLGNHDFNFGLDYLTTVIADAQFPYVLANVRLQSGPDGSFLPPYVILDREVLDGAGERHPLRIGILGLTPPQIIKWDCSALDGQIETLEFLETAQAYIPRMRAEGADIILVLAHTGILPDTAGMQEENAGLPLSRLDGADALFTGHVHMVYPSPAFADIDAAQIDTGHLNGCPTVMAGYWGSHLGVVDLLLERTSDGWRVEDSRAETLPIFSRATGQTITPLVEDDPELVQLAQPSHEATLTYIRKSIGQSTAPLHSYFSMVCGSAHLDLIAGAKRDYVAAQLAGGPFEGLPILGAATPFKSGGRSGPDYFTEVPAGDLTIRSVTDMYLYPNNMRAVKITGAQLREWLERSAGFFQQVDAGARDVQLLDPAVPSYYFDVIGGVTYDFDLSLPARYDLQGTLVRPKGQRVKNLALNGQPVTPEMEFIVATNSYRVDGGGAFPGVTEGEVVLETQANTRDVVLDYIRRKGAISPSPAPQWGFAPVRGATALFQTSPRARLYMQDVAKLNIEDLGDDDSGFCTFRLLL